MGGRVVGAVRPSCRVMMPYLGHMLAKFSVQTLTHTAPRPTGADGDIAHI